MIGYRHFVTSLAAVFIALGLGIFIGHFFSQVDEVVPPDMIHNEFAPGMEDAQYTALLSSNIELTKSVTIYQEFSKTLLESLLAGRLSEKRLALVITGHQQVPADLLEILNLAGAQIVSQTIVGDLGIQADALKASLVDYYSLPANASADDIRRQIGISSGVIIAGKDSPNTADYLMQWNLVHFAGNYEQPIDGFIILGGAVEGALDASTSFDVGLILGLGQHPGVKVGVECSDVAVSYMPEYQQLRLRTIDNIDQIPGQYALVMTLDQVVGNFGIKSTANRLVPPWTP